MCRRPGTQPDLYVAEDAVDEVRKYLDSRSDFRSLKIVNDVNAGICGRFRRELRLKLVPPAGERGGRIKNVGWLCFRVFRELALTVLNNRFARAEARLRMNFSQMAAERYDAFFSPMAMAPESIRQSRIPCFTVIYDTIPQIYPEIYDKNPGVQWTRDLVDSLTGHDNCFSISEATKKDFLKFAPGLDEKRITTIPLAAAERFRPCKAEGKIGEVREKYGIPAGSRYLLSLCNIAPHKNLPFTIRAFAKFARTHRDVVLVLAGGGWSGYVAEMEKSLSAAEDARQRIFMPGYIADEDLAALYSGALAFVYMSQYEGFGLPPLEAMQCGTPVIASDSSSLPEVVGDAGLLVPPTDLDGCAVAMSKVADDSDLARTLRSKGLERCKRFSWSRAVDIIDETMTRVCAKRIPPPAFRVLYDATILRYGLNANSGRSGIYVASYEILKALQDHADLSIDLWVLPQFVPEIRRYLALHPELDRVELADVASLNDGGGYGMTAQCLESYAPPPLDGRISASVRLIWLAYLSVRWPLIRLTRCLYRHEIKSRARLLRAWYSAFFSPVFIAPDDVIASGLPRYTVLYDAIPMLYPQFYAHATEEMWTSVLARRLTAEDHCFAISECTKRDFKKFAPNLKTENVEVIPLAAAGRFYRCTDKAKIENVLKKYKLPTDKPYFLSLCTIEPRKNLAVALKAFAAFAKENGDVVFVLAGGGWDVYSEKWKNVLASVESVRDRIHLPGYIADEDLAPLYSGARAFVYLSIYEGFGLPPLEAMQCGTPVLCSNSSSLPEVVGDAALTVSPADVAGATQAMLKLAVDDSLCARFREKGLVRAKLFTWARASEIILSAMATGR